MTSFVDFLAERGCLLADGATGTNLFARGLATGDSPELWNVNRPEDIRELHRTFLDAGSDIVLTNSFGGNARRLMLHQAQNRAHELNVRAAENARAAINACGRPAIAAGSMGPTGDILAPVGPLSHEEAVAVFREQAEGLAEGGADVLWIETISSVEELRAAVEGAMATGLPIVATMSFDTNGRTMMGLGAAEARKLAGDLAAPLAAFGANCGIGPAQLLATLLGFAETSGPPIVAKANCGVPEYVDGAIRYSGTVQIMADYAVLARDAGARVIGGCCGTTSTHIAAMREALDRTPGGDVPDFARIEDKLGEIEAPNPTQPIKKRERRRRA